MVILCMWALTGTANCFSGSLREMQMRSESGKVLEEEGKKPQLFYISVKVEEMKD